MAEKKEKAKPKEPEPMLRRIDVSAGKFVGLSGAVYHIESSLSVSRYAHFQIYEKEMAYGLTMKGMFEHLQKLYDLNNKMKFADAAVLINDLMRGVKKIQERQPAIMKICALYMNTVDEDRGTINQDMIDRKIEDWADLDVRDFFQIALHSVNGLIEIYNSVSQNISDLVSQGNE